MKVNLSAILQSFVFFIMLLAMSGFAHADSYEQMTDRAFDALNDESYEDAFRLFFVLSKRQPGVLVDKGLLNSNQKALAHLYYSGLGTDKDITKAIKWYKESANRNDIW